MRFSAGVPGESRKDKRTTAEVQTEKKMASDSGKWIKNLWPETALQAIKQKQTEARSYHDSVTLPFGCKNDDDGVDAITGVGILPAALIAEYGDRMRQFKGQFDNLVETTFLADPQQWVDWAVQAHNGTFDPANYPGCSRQPDGSYVVDVATFREKMRKKFYIRTEPLPVPNASHFEASIAALLGTDAASVNLRLADAECEAKRELMRRLIAPVKAMAAKLAEPAPEGKQSPIFRDTLIGNLREIAELAPKLNITGDATIDSFVMDVRNIAVADPDTLRKHADARTAAAESAADLLKRLEGYKF